MKTHKRTQRGTVAALCAAIVLGLALPISGLAREYYVRGPVTATGITGTVTVGSVQTGLYLSGNNSAIGSGGGTVTPGSDSSLNIYRFLEPSTTITLTGSFYTAGGVAGVLTDDYFNTTLFLFDKTIIDVSGNATGDMRGFYYVGSNAFESDLGFNPHAYTHLPDLTDIVVNNQGNGNAFGVQFWDPDADVARDIASFDGNFVYFGNIDVTSKNNAYGFVAGDVYAEIVNSSPVIFLGDIDVKATETNPDDPNGYAAGIQLGVVGTKTSAGIMSYPAFLRTGEIDVNTNRMNAFGVHAESLNAFWVVVEEVSGIDSTHGCFDEIKVTSTNDSSTAVTAGIFITGESAPWHTSLFGLSDNITVKAESGEAWGIRDNSTKTDIWFLEPYPLSESPITISVSGAETNTGIAVKNEAQLFIQKELVIQVSGAGDNTGILLSNNTWFDLDKNLTINVSGTGDNIGVEAHKNLTIRGTGSAIADMGKVIVSGNLVIGRERDGPRYDSVNVVVAEGSKFHGANELHYGTSLQLKFTSLGGLVEGFGTWGFGALSEPEGELLDYSTTAYYFDQDELGYWRIFATRATVRSDAFLAAAMIHNRYTGYTMVRDKFISDEPRYGGGYFGQTPYPYQAPFQVPFRAPYQSPYGVDDPHEINPLAKRERMGTSWLNYVGRADKYGDWNLGADGIQIGSDLYVTNRNQLGIIFGYEGGWARKDNDINNDRVLSDDIYLGFYAARIFQNGADLRFIYNHGWQSFDMARNNEEFLSTFSGRTHEMNLELGKRVHWGSGWSARPSIATDLYLNHLNSTVESEGVVYKKMNFAQCFLRFGLDFRYQGRYWVFNSGLSHAYDVNQPELRTVANELPLQGSPLGRQIWLYNFNVECQVYRNVSLFGGYDVQAAVGRHANACQHIGFIGGLVRW